jgi:hypothetical protein
MENLELTTEEKIELKKRGFFVKEYFRINDIFTIFPIIFVIAIWLFPIHLLLSLFIVLTYLVILLLYIISWKAFFFNKWWKQQLYLHWRVLSGLNDSLIARVLAFYSRLYYSQPDLTGLVTSFWVIAVPLLHYYIYEVYSSNIILYLPLLISILYILRQLVEHFHPLYAFGNLGEKIQSLTPQIESQSKEIQENFEKDTNFGVLHSGFEKLSLTFSAIVSLVLKLENIEKKANKWNLFDSNKYINSLRSDILTPLISLRTFLEKQKTELMNSQKELSRVRVWWSDESWNTELASKRSESLMMELEKNILSLDEMILKMG